MLMKVWIKYLIGVAFGVLAAFILPGNAAISSAVAFLTELFIRVGRYIVIPLLFTSAIVAINKLRSSRLLLKTSLLTVLIIVASSLILTAVGLISILMVKLPRIPITVDTATEVFHLDVKGMILSLFPYSGFDALREGSFLLVCLVMAFVVGWKVLQKKQLLSLFLRFLNHHQIFSIILQTSLQKSCRFWELPLCATGQLISVQ